jgi:hypothetical protein
MRALTKNLRRRAAILIAVAYAFCVLAPSAALAVVSNPTVFHCIGELSAQSAPAAHGHADGSTHRHDQSGHDHGTHDHGAVPDHQSDDGGKGHAGTCCGLFCVSAIAHDPGLTFGVTTPASSAVATAANHLAGRALCPLHRPPIA